MGKLTLGSSVIDLMAKNRIRLYSETEHKRFFPLTHEQMEHLRSLLLKSQGKPPVGERPV